VLPLVLLGGVSLYAMRAGSSKNGSAAPSGCAATAGENSPANGRRAGEPGPGEAKQAGGQRVDQAAGLPAAGARDAADDSQVAAVDAEPKPLSTAGDAAGSRPLPTRSETPIPAAGGDLAQASTPGDAAPAPDELTERCRRADAGGRGRPQSVLTACRPAIEANPDSADIMVMLARAAMDLGRVSEARTWAKKALQINRNLPDAYVFLGGAEQGLGRPAEAKAAYKKYIELAPGGRHARELRAVLDSL
jgi:tetratricopeptide (TPR) repeat protein